MAARGGGAPPAGVPPKSAKQLDPRQKRIMFAVGGGGLLALLFMFTQRGGGGAPPEATMVAGSPPVGSSFADNGEASAALANAVTDALFLQGDQITTALNDLPGRIREDTRENADAMNTRLGELTAGFASVAALAEQLRDESPQPNQPAASPQGQPAPAAAAKQTDRDRILADPRFTATVKNAKTVGIDLFDSKGNARYDLAAPGGSPRPFGEIHAQAKKRPKPSGSTKTTKPSKTKGKGK